MSSSQQQRSRCAMRRMPSELLATKLLVLRGRQLAVSVDFLAPERRHCRSVCADAYLGVIEGGSVVDDTDVFQIVEENQSSEVRFVRLNRLRQRHVKLS